MKVLWEGVAERRGNGNHRTYGGNILRNVGCMKMELWGGGGVRAELRKVNISQDFFF